MVLTSKQKWAAFWRGFGSALNLFPAPAKVISAKISKTPEEFNAKVAESLRKDWVHVGQDLCNAMDKELERILLERKATCALCKAAYTGGKRCAKCGWNQFHYVAVKDVSNEPTTTN